jgi:hypothetical protein
MRIKLFFVLLLSGNIYADSEIDKGLGYNSPINAKDQITYDYINDLLRKVQSQTYVALMDSIKNKGVSSQDTLKHACNLEGSTYSMLDFMNLNEKFTNPIVYKIELHISELSLKEAQKITLGQCHELLVTFENLENNKGKRRAVVVPEKREQ